MDGSRSKEELASFGELVVRHFSYRECMEMMGFTKSLATFERRLKVAQAHGGPTPVDRSLTLPQLQDFVRIWESIECSKRGLSREKRRQKRLRMKQKVDSSCLTENVGSIADEGGAGA